MDQDFFGYPPDTRERFAALEAVAPYGALYRHPTVPKAFHSSEVEERDGGSALTLSPAERDNRIDGNEKRRRIPEPLDVLRHTTIQSLLESRALPCLLATSNQSRRSNTSNGDKRQRRYPIAVVAWSEHTRAVLEHRPTGELRQLDVFLPCWSDEQERWSEATEASYLFERALTALPFTLAKTSACKGLAAKYIVDGNRVAVCIEEKSTHNLRIPERVDTLVKSYADTNWWTRHPIGQLARQMLVNECAYGVITSGTRTYFVHASMEGDSVVFYVSRRWYVGEPEYLRAWAWLVKVAMETERVNLRGCKDGGWMELSPDKKGDDAGGDQEDNDDQEDDHDDIAPARSQS